MSNEGTEHFLARTLIDKAFTVEKTKGVRIRTIKYKGEYFYLYRDANVWERFTREEIKLLYVLPLVNQAGGLTSKRMNLIMDCITAQVMRSTSRHLEFNTWTNDVVNRATIPVKNGLVIRTEPEPWEDPNAVDPFVLVPHSPEYFSINQLPYEYNPDAKCPQWLKFIDEITCGKKDRARVLQQWAGYLFKRTDGEQRFLLYFGEGSNGKGVYANILRKMVGANNCSNVGFDQFGNKYAIASMLGMMVNMSNESGRNVKVHAENILKTLTGGDTYSFEAKYKDPTSARPTAKIMLATNELPRFNDKTRGAWRRVLLVPFELNVAEDQVDKGLYGRLQRELPGILNWALEGMLDLEQNRGFTEESGIKQILERYRKDSDPTREYLLDYYEYDPELRGKSVSSVYEHYKGYCRDGGYQIMSKSRFVQQVERVFPDCRKTRARIPKTKTREFVFSGLRKNLGVI
jgi:P4 family phage/plasmid primase-like protien